ncbi:MAG: carboxypeptidase regulatory-like domain-containing protein [Devosia nanyangense]|uniref:Carboxypeptidase regulatory-like domain-containing protein n=1 Tax=Devosia nanyangense TaxID=1228055 RepID=A0A933KYS3_9HYPH|nr:carboxypeptidase regulatory-like domain-containing protein [Devosia nanyangense]
MASWVRVFCAAAAVLFLLAVGGCATVGAPAVMAARFDPAEAAYVLAPGKAHVRGQAFVRQNNGKLLRATGTDVFLIPRTAYADERIAALYGERRQLRTGARLPDSDPLYDHYMRKTIASSGGSFDFDGVADGDYYVVAMIHLPAESVFLQFPILEQVTVKGGKSVKLVMRGY